MERIIHAVLPLAVITAAVVLTALRKIDSATGVALIAASGGLGAMAVAGGRGRPGPPPPGV